MNTTIERCELASDLSISRILTGLWQIGDMEKDDNHLEYNNRYVQICMPGLERFLIQVVDKLDTNTNRGEGGCGSTGK